MAIPSCFMCNADICIPVVGVGGDMICKSVLIEI